MKTYLTVAEMMLRLRIPQSQYNNFKHWCYRHQHELDPIDCKLNKGYHAYNVNLVREKYPHLALAKPDKVSTPEPDETPVETPLSAAERLAAAINTSTGQNLTGGDVLDAFNRGKDYQRMRRYMARTIRWVRKERRKSQHNSKYASSSASVCLNARIAIGNDVVACDNLGKSCKVNAERAEKSAETARSAATVASLFVGGAFLVLIIISIIRDILS